MIKLTAEAVQLLCLQRTQYLNTVQDQFRAEMAETLENLLPHLPNPMRSVLDIGGGCSGIGILLQKQFGCDVYILDKNTVELNKRVIGWNKSAEDFGGYNSFRVVQNLWRESGCDLSKLHFIPAGPDAVLPEVDLAMSLLSWGFHYPLSTYWDKIRARTIIADCRDGAPDTVPEGAVTIYKGQKHSRLKWSGSVS